MNAYRIETDFDDFVILEDNFQDAASTAVAMFNERLEAARQEHLDNLQTSYDDKIKNGREVPEWIKKGLSGEDDEFADYEIYKVKKLGKLAPECCDEDE